MVNYYIIYLEPHAQKCLLNLIIGLNAKVWKFTSLSSELDVDFAKLKFLLEELKTGKKFYKWTNYCPYFAISIHIRGYRYEVIVYENSSHKYSKINYSAGQK